MHEGTVVYDSEDDEEGSLDDDAAMMKRSAVASEIRRQTHRENADDPYAPGHGGGSPTLRNSSFAFFGMLGFNEDQKEKSSLDYRLYGILNKNRESLRASTRESMLNRKSFKNSLLD